MSFAYPLALDVANLVTRSNDTVVVRTPWFGVDLWTDRPNKIAWFKPDFLGMNVATISRSFAEYRIDSVQFELSHSALHTGALPGSVTYAMMRSETDGSVIPSVDSVFSALTLEIPSTGKPVEVKLPADDKEDRWVMTAGGGDAGVDYCSYGLFLHLEGHDAKAVVSNLVVTISFRSYLPREYVPELRLLPYGNRSLNFRYWRLDSPDDYVHGSQVHETHDGGRFEQSPFRASFERRSHEPVGELLKDWVKLQAALDAMEVPEFRRVPYEVYFFYGTPRCARRILGKVPVALESATGSVILNSPLLLDAERNEKQSPQTLPLVVASTTHASTRSDPFVGDTRRGGASATDRRSRRGGRGETSSKMR